MIWLPIKKKDQNLEHFLCQTCLLTLVYENQLEKVF